jgi:two-component system sensor histidine kinase MtrB
LATASPTGSPRPRPAAPPIRRRLAIAFLATAGLAAGALALGGWLVAREARLDASVDRALASTRLAALVAADRLAGSSDPARAQRLLEALAGRGEFQTVVLAGSSAFVSAPTVSAREAPPGLRRLVARGQVAWERADVGGSPFLIAGARVPGTRVDLLLFFDETQVREDLRELGLILAAGWALVVLAAAAGGSWLARRALAPVARASASARAVAEDLLGVRVAGRGRDELADWAGSFSTVADALEARLGALEEARARERRFTADVAHELRTPLTALVAEAALLAERAVDMPADARRLSVLLAGDVERLRRLVEDLLEISRLDAGADALRVEPVDLARLAGAVVAGRGWDASVAIAGEATARTDPRAVERVVANLVENALVHGGGAARVTVRASDGAAEIEVADSGPGIPLAAQDEIFRRFAKLDRSRASAGTGLGLAIAREHARRLGGEVALASEPGRGARFTLRLPVAEPLHAGDGGVTGPGHDTAVEHGQEA